MYIKGTDSEKQYAIWEITKDELVLIYGTPRSPIGSQWADNIKYKEIRTWTYEICRTWDVITKDEAFLDLI